MQRASDISKRCTACGREIWPSLTVAIIVLVRKPHPSGRRELEEVLLVHARNFAGNFYGLVAGFVETGESLEECLQREVMEETGLHIGNIRYRASQPWPYPSGLMVGYFADYISGDIRLQREELECGGWFTRDNLEIHITQVSGEWTPILHFRTKYPRQVARLSSLAVGRHHAFAHCV